MAFFKMFFESRSQPLDSEKLKQLPHSLATFNVSWITKLWGKIFCYLLLWVRPNVRGIYNVSLSESRRNRGVINSFKFNAASDEVLKNFISQFQIWHPEKSSKIEDWQWQWQKKWWGCVMKHIQLLCLYAYQSTNSSKLIRNKTCRNILNTIADIYATLMDLDCIFAIKLFSSVSKALNPVHFLRSYLSLLWLFASQYKGYAWLCTCECTCLIFSLQCTYSKCEASYLTLI